MFEAHCLQQEDRDVVFWVGSKGNQQDTSIMFGGCQLRNHERFQLV